MSSEAPAEITQILSECNGPQDSTMHQLLDLVYDELRLLAEACLHGERPDHTLQPTALVHEAYVKLADIKHIRWQNRMHFYSMAAKTMRRILVRYAEKRQTQKRGGELVRVTLHEELVLEESDLDLVALNEALTQLAALDQQASDIVEMRFFGGCTIPETAEVLGVSSATVKRKWESARAWLLKTMLQADATS